MCSRVLKSGEPCVAAATAFRAMIERFMWASALSSYPWCRCWSTDSCRAVFSAAYRNYGAISFIVVNEYRGGNVQGIHQESFLYATLCAARVYILRDVGTCRGREDQTITVRDAIS